MSLAVLATGPLALVQDLGRPGHAAQGVGTSGAADRGAFALGNRLVGNPPTAAALEIVLGGLRLRAQRPVLLTLTGAVAPATVDGRPVGHACLLRLATGDMLALSTPPAGLRTYVALRGGVDAPPVLGSRSTDTLSGLGPPPLAAGDTLRLGPPSRPLPDLDSAPVARAGPVALRLLPAPAPTGPTTRAGPGPSVRTATGSRCACSDRRSAAGPRSWRARACCPARCRCRRTAHRCCSWPTRRSPAAIPSSASSMPARSTGLPSCVPARPCASSEPALNLRASLRHGG